MIRTFWRFVSALTLVLGVSACQHDLEVHTTFERVHGLGAGAVVQLDGQQIGTVTDVSPSAGGYRVTLSLDPARASAVQSDAVAYLDPRRPGAVTLLNPASDAGAITAGATLEGIDSEAAIAVWQAGGALQAASRFMSDLTTMLERQLDEEAWEEQRARLEADLERLNASAARAAGEIEQEIRGRLEKLDQESRQGLHGLGEAVAEALRRIADELEAFTAEPPADEPAPVQGP